MAELKLKRRPWKASSTRSSAATTWLGRQAGPDISPNVQPSVRRPRDVLYSNSPNGVGRQCRGHAGVCHPQQYADDEALKGPPSDRRLGQRHGLCRQVDRMTEPTLVTGASRGLAPLAGTCRARLQPDAECTRRDGRPRSRKNYGKRTSPCACGPDDAGRHGSRQVPPRRCDVLINNAGMGGPGVWRVVSADNDALIDLNIRALVSLTSAALPGMLVGVADASSTWPRSPLLATEHGRLCRVQGVCAVPPKPSVKNSATPA